MPNPVFTDVGQIGIVVRDVDAAVRRYETEYGIGPWQFYEVTPDIAPDLREFGKPIQGGTRCATAKVGHVWWELIQPLDDNSQFARFLAEKGEGVHHIAVKTPDYDRAVAMQVDSLPLSGSFMDIQVSYLPTAQSLGVILEVFQGFPEDDDSTQPEG